MNGYGYFWGMMAGIIGALIVGFFPDLSPLNAFPILLVCSLFGSIAGSLLTPVENEQVLADFYTRTRPWGFWKPIHRMVVSRDPSFQANKDIWRDIINVLVGTAWQTAFIALPIYVVIKLPQQAITCVAVVIVTSIFLKKNWLDRMSS
jgi:hypothetical protein